MAADIVFNEELVMLDIEAGSDTEAIEKLATRLYEKGYVKESYIGAVQAREKVFPTGLPTEAIGVAIPHTDVEHVNEAAMAIGVLKNTVPFQMMGVPENTVDVKIMFMMAIKEPHAQIEMLQKLMSLFSQGDLLQKINENKDPSIIKEIFTREL